MCKSLAEGGQRCAAHTRAAYAAASATYDPDNAASVEARQETAIEYASTDEGHKHFLDQADIAMADLEFDEYARLKSIATRGVAMRGANVETAAQIKDQANTAAHAYEANKEPAIPSNVEPVTTWDALQKRPNDTYINPTSRKASTMWTMEHLDLGQGGFASVVTELHTRHNTDRKGFTTSLTVKKLRREPGAGYTETRFSPMEDSVTVTTVPVDRYTGARLEQAHTNARTAIQDYLTVGSPGYNDNAHANLTAILARAARPNEE